MQSQTKSSCAISIDQMIGLPMARDTAAMPTSATIAASRREAQAYSSRRYMIGSSS